MIELHKRYISWWGKKLKISNYGLLWVSFIKGVLSWAINLSLHNDLNENYSWCR